MGYATAGIVELESEGPECERDFDEEKRGDYGRNEGKDL